eukprot:TRINITY_DN16656_c0_g2_i3.p1 TRINITY_DN16656_c0_g2~~TRINITY_DN16656_c0_g2_i3.p1  ORF type:complete len:161 (-),score=19.40 TRINITY_DN16656_c0_g2_i3:469-951(-)
MHNKKRRTKNLLFLQVQNHFVHVLLRVLPLVQSQCVGCGIELVTHFLSLALIALHVWFHLFCQPHVLAVGCLLIVCKTSVWIFPFLFSLPSFHFVSTQITKSGNLKVFSGFFTVLQNGTEKNGYELYWYSASGLARYQIYTQYYMKILLPSSFSYIGCNS